MSASAERVRTPAVLLGVLLLCLSPSAFALNPALDVRQYAHTSWKIHEGFPKGLIGAIAQTADGYLWLGTEFGLVRFDGLRNVPWEPPPDQPLPSSVIYSLLAARDGTLWIGTSKGLASWKEGTLTRYPQLAGQYVFRLIEDREGSVWAGTFGTPTGRLCAIRNADVRCSGEDGRLGLGVLGLYEDHKGFLWVGVTDGLWRWKPGPPEFHSMPGELDAVRSFVEADDGALLMASRTGIRRLADGKTEAYRLSGFEGPFQATALFRDRDGSLWIGTRGKGLVHIHQGRTDVFGASEGLSGDYVGAFFEDREGSLWVATTNGLDRFHGLAVVTFNAKQGLSGDYATVLAGVDGVVWFGGNDGLSRWDHGRFAIPRTGSVKRDGTLNGQSPNSLFLDDRGRVWISTLGGVGYLENDRFVPLKIFGGNVHAFAQDSAGSVWVANQEQGLFRVSPRFEIQQTPWAGLGREDHATALAGDPLKGGLWLGFFNGGLAYLAEGQVKAAYAAADGLGEGRVNGLTIEKDGTLWAATAGGLSRLKNGRIATMTHKNGLPCDSVHWALEDDARSFWLFMPCGLVRIARSDVDAWSAAVDANRGTVPLIRATVFDASDGVRTRAEPLSYRPIVTKSSDGRLWFESLEGVSVFDPGHIPRNSLPPPVHVEQVIADRTAHEALGAAGPLRLPALTRDLEIDYTAPSLVAPEKNQFRVKLEGRDPDWRDMGNRRQAFYADLAPGPYRFHVIASNNSGVWNEAGDVLEFSIAPAYYQRTSFRTAVVAGIVALLWAMYRYRVRQIARLLDARVQARVDERTRIARELHDTLLQSFHGLLFRFQAATNRLPDSDVRKQFESAIDQAAQAITEGRDAVQNLRVSTVVTNDLAEAIGALGRELAASHQADEANATPAAVNVSIEGMPRDLHPILRDDIYRIAGEALRNAFRHSRARHVEVAIRYDDKQLQVRVRDDGKGIDPKMLDEPRQGHFGLGGMRERAEVIGGRFDLWSKPGLGTEIELTIPAAAAYATPRRRGRSWWFARKTGTDA